MVGKVYGSLIVTGYHAATMMAKVRCECGTTEYRRRFMLEQGRARMCKECQERKSYYETLKLDAQLLTTLDPAVAARLMKAFAQHLATCKKYKAPPTRLATFIAEALADADFGEELDQSFEARYERSNPQSYREYQQPRRTEIV